MASWTMVRKLQRARSWYAAQVSLDRTQMQVDDNLVNLGLGKAVTVEIKTGASPVCPAIKHDTLRER
jgi:hypothetical protein